MWLLLITFALTTAISVWVVFFDGAERIEGTFTSAILIDRFAPLLSPPLLRAFVVFAWLAQLAILLARVL
jgi:hypothetical protein